MDEPLILSMPLTVFVKNDIPAIRLRKEVTDWETAKLLISAAFHETPILILPKFSDKLMTIANLQERGFIHKDKETGEYRFVF